MLRIAETPPDPDPRIRFVEKTAPDPTQNRKKTLFITFFLLITQIIKILFRTKKNVCNMLSILLILAGFYRLDPDSFLC